MKDHTVFKVMIPGRSAGGQKTRLQWAVCEHPTSQSAIQRATEPGMWLGNRLGSVSREHDQSTLNAGF